MLRPCSRSVFAFTLVELLVVLTILAVLAAMAVPALRSALDRADRTVCLSNLRQLGQATSEFVADHGHYPAAELELRDRSDRVVERVRWYHALAPYLGSGERAASSGQGRVLIDPLSGEASGIVLPSEDDADDTVFSDVLRCPAVDHRAVGRNGAYGYNHQYLGDARVLARSETDRASDRSEAVYRNYPVRPSQITAPASTVLFLDSDGTGEGAYRPASAPDPSARGNHAFTVDPPTLPLLGGVGAAPVRWGSDAATPGAEPTLRSRPADRHRGGCCVLFVDGRAKWMPVTQLAASDRWWSGTGDPLGRE